MSKWPVKITNQAAALANSDRLSVGKQQVGFSQKRAVQLPLAAILQTISRLRRRQHRGAFELHNLPDTVRMEFAVSTLASSPFPSSSSIDVPRAMDQMVKPMRAT